MVHRREAVPFHKDHMPGPERPQFGSQLSGSSSVAVVGYSLGRELLQSGSYSHAM